MAKILVRTNTKLITLPDHGYISQRKKPTMEEKQKQKEFIYVPGGWNFAG